MRNKFKIILPDGSKYKPPERTMVVMNTDGIVFLASNHDWDGWYVRKLSDVVQSYNIVMENKHERQY